ncbi:MAG: hypothetical protein JJT78_07625 [Leptospira sp.]|nr:hypothetical protein [Leptospira sp.]
MATKKKVTPKKSAPSKKAAPKKNSAAKKKSAPKKQQKIQTKSIETTSSFNEIEEEESNPTLPPVYTPTGSNEPDTEEESSSPMLKYLIISAIVLVGIIAYSMMKKKDTATVPSEKLEETKQTDSAKVEETSKSPETSSEETKEDGSKPASDVAKDSETPKTDTTTAPALKGYAVAQMVSGKTFAEAGEHCKSISMSLPNADQLRAIKPSDVPSELKNSTVWTSNVVGSRNLKFVFSTGKALYASAGDKFQVLCKE